MGNCAKNTQQTKNAQYNKDSLTLQPKLKNYHPSMESTVPNKSCDANKQIPDTLDKKIKNIFQQLDYNSESVQIDNLNEHEIQIIEIPNREQSVESDREQIDPNIKIKSEYHFYKIENAIYFPFFPDYPTSAQPVQ